MHTSVIKSAAVFLGLAVLGLWVLPAFAGHNGAAIDINSFSCEPTTFDAGIVDPDGTHKVSNMYLVVDDGASVQYVNIPTDGTTATISVGPFGSDTTVSWNVFGGGERAYDQPLWNGYGGATFSADIAAYAAQEGGYGWVLDGVDEPNPFVNWNEVEVPGCSPSVKDDCKNGGWEAFGFRNQGQCVSFFETGNDSR